MRPRLMLVLLVVAGCAPAPKSSTTGPPRVVPLPASLAAPHPVSDEPVDPPPPPRKIVGRVVDAEGRGIAGARVVCESGALRVAGTAGADGGFAIEVEPLGPTVRCEVSTPGRAAFAGPWMPVRPRADLSDSIDCFNTANDVWVGSIVLGPAER